MGTVKLKGICRISRMATDGVAGYPVPAPSGFIQGHAADADRARRAEIFPLLAEDVETRRRLDRCSRREPAGPNRNTRRDARAAREEAATLSSARPNAFGECAEGE
jgi:hypothetical protein